MSDSRFHQVYSIALLLLSLLTAHLFNQPVSASSILCAILVLLLFILCIGLSPAQVLLFSTRSSPKKKALDYLSPEDGDHSIESALPSP